LPVNDQKSLYENSALGDKFAASNRPIGIHHREADFIGTFFANPAAALLEGGCGSGRVAFALAELGYSNIAAFDFSRRLIADALQTARARNSSISFFEADACGLGGCADESFEYVFYGAQLISIIPMPHRVRALLEVKRVLSRDGVFVFSVLNRRHQFWRRVLLKCLALRSVFTQENFSPVELPYLRLGSGLNWAMMFRPSPTVTLFTAEEIVGLVEALGFKVLRCSDSSTAAADHKAFAIYLACRRAP
jgi:SAM-dependent methyltransferase